MKKSILANAICAALVVPVLWSSAVSAQDTAKKDDAEQLEKVVVTGSLIPRAQIETASPVITITTNDIEKQGFRNVYDALRAQPLATGAVQDNTFTAGFTPGANTISLLGLDPGFTLFLIDGRPMADYPLLYNGQSNFVDISSIPMAMVDRIEILPGNQSSIYGSSAIAGVINIILKKKIDGVVLNFREGGYSDGGGQSERLQLTGGWNSGDFNAVYGLQVNDQKPIFGFQRDISRSTNSAPTAGSQVSPRNYLYAYYAGGNKYIDPGSQCDNLSDLFGGTITKQTRTGFGSYCGSKESVGYGSLLNKSQSGAAYVSTSFRLNDNAELYGDVLYNVSTNNFYTGPSYSFWATNNNAPYYWNPINERLEFFQRTYAPEEQGGLLAGSERTLTHSYNLNLGARGNIGGGDWAYDAYYSRSEYKVTDKQPRALRDKVNAFMENMFLGPQQGEYYGYPVYTPDVSKFYRPITPAEFASFTDLVNSKSKTTTDKVHVQINNADIFALPAGSVGMAAILEAGQQTWDNGTDPRVVNGDFWGLTGTSGKGDRDNSAAGVEFSVPVFSMLTADLAGRYDRYKNDGGGSDGQSTYKLGLEFRPFDSVLIRGNYGTAFRAPDMGYTFAGKSGFFTSVTDYYKCAKYDPTHPIEDCDFNGVQIQGEQRGNLDLKSITAKSWGYGIVWSPSENFNVKADYYNIKISDKVVYQSLDQLLQTEAACRSGALDINSGSCQAALSQITRSSATATIPEDITGIVVRPINIAKENVNGLLASLQYRLDGGATGDFTFGLDYNLELDHHAQTYPDDPNVDYLREPFYSSEFRNILSGSITWEKGAFATTLYGIRYGKTPNYTAQINESGYAAPGAGTIGAYTLYNGSVTYHATDDASLSLAVNNIMNKEPPKDKTWTAYPYFNNFNYSAYGRNVFLELEVRFGGTKKQ